MPPLHRHQLARLRPAAWQRLVAAQEDVVARDCLAHWAAHGLPAVVTRQPRLPGADHDLLALAVAAPGRWERARLGFSVRLAEVGLFDEFPRIDQLPLPPSRRARREQPRLCAALAACGVTARVYGSHGWQAMTELDHVREGSDLDLWVAVADETQADAVAAVLDRGWPGLPRLDGELCFADGSAVAWREWRAWRAGRVRAVLVKTLVGCELRWSARQEGGTASDAVAAQVAA